MLLRQARPALGFSTAARKLAPRDSFIGYSAMSAPERLRAAPVEGEPLHPGYAGEMECGIGGAWLNVPFQKGG